MTFAVCDQLGCWNEAITSLNNRFIVPAPRFYIKAMVSTALFWEIALASVGYSKAIHKTPTNHVTWASHYSLCYLIHKTRIWGKPRSGIYQIKLKKILKVLERPVDRWSLSPCANYCCIAISFSTYLMASGSSLHPITEDDKLET